MGMQICALLLLLLSPGLSETSTFSYFEIIVPRKLEPRDGIGNKDECYYSGYVEGIPESVAVLSTCSGLWGHLMVYDLNYEIEPVKSSSTFQHIIYRTMAEEDSPGRCGVIDVDIKDQAAENREHQIPEFQTERQLAIGKDELNTHDTSSRYLECYFIADKAKFRLEDSNETLVTMKMLQYIHLTSEMYRPFGLHVILIGLEIWNEKDLITITHLLDQVVGFFLNYVQKFLRHRAHFDHTELIVGGAYEYDGYSYGDNLCTNFPSVATVKARSKSVLYDAISVAHEMGHSLGFIHDNSKRNVAKGCVCKCIRGGKCVMWSHASRILCTEFSNCSRAKYYDMIRKPEKTCLLNIPERKAFGVQTCGNGVIDEEEECDCGLDEVCQQNGCCLANCTVKPGADCMSGLCCENCEFRREGKVCRKRISECDLPEYCNGTSEWCPSDVFKQDGTPCGNNVYCFQGRCPSLERQCKAIFGKAAQLAPLTCYKAVNTKGDRCGNCGGDGLAYKKCQVKDVLCGRLQCVNIKKIPRSNSFGSIVQTPVDDILCWGTEFNVGMEVADVGSVKDGAACGDNKICINRTCVNITALNYDCTDKKCSGRGVCNNNRNCHCNFGWAPPDCKFKGRGGSIDSGPPPILSVSKDIILGTVIGGVLFFLLVTSLALFKIPQISQFFGRQT
nr:disintegrin and metalloproteinase domain-containing protein 20-like isoform X3 [Pelodiscus sinensis]|eukprot:XP_025042700.1 disintegrin and metalloproteinase domain-containing protein 20-like isoform X3 [Pelodiscus sinensis]